MKKHGIDEISELLKVDASQLHKWEEDYRIEVQRDHQGERLYTKKEEDIFRKIKFIKSQVSDENSLKKIVLKIINMTNMTPTNPTYNSLTMSDVAKVAGVSLGTVSRVINNRDDKIKISETTRKKVLSTVKELGYKPNPFASALRSQRSGVIGIVVRDINDPFLRQIIRDIQKEAHKKGIEILIGHAEYETLTAERQLNLMINYWFDGLILLGNLPGDEKLIHQLNVKDTPMVAVASGFDMNLPSIDFDNIFGASAALEYLFSLGHKDIAFIGNTALAGVKQRLDVYEKMMRQANLYKEHYVYPSINTRRDATEHTRKLMSLEDPPTAIFIPQDYLALGSMSVIWQMGLNIPKDVSVFGYDNIDEAADAFIPLSTIEQPTELAAKNAIELLSDIINNVESVNKKVKIKPEICIRKSCRNLNSVHP